MPKASQGPYLAPKPNKSGTWEIVFRQDGRSVRRSTGTANRAEAGRVLAAFITAQAQNEATHVIRPISWLLDFYLDYHVLERVVDVERVKWADAPVREFFGDMTIGDLDDTVFIAYARKRRSGNRTISDGTIRRELEHLRAALHYAARHFRRTNVAKGEVPTVTLPARPESRSLVLSSAQMDEMLVAAQNNFKEIRRITMFIALARFTAARRDAILGLTWDRVDLERRLIDYREPGRTRTKKRRVPLPIDARLMPYLLQAKARHDKLPPEKQTGFVLGKPKSIRHAFELVAAKIGVPDATPHTLRHSWATDAATRGVPIRQIAAFMGDSEETITRNYVHLAPDFMADVLPSAPAAPPAPSNTNDRKRHEKTPDNSGQRAARNRDALSFFAVRRVT